MAVTIGCNSAYMEFFRKSDRMKATSKILKLTAIIAVVFFTTTGITRAQNGSAIDWTVLIRQLDSTRIAVQSMPDDTAKLSRYYFISRYCYDVDSAGK